MTGACTDRRCYGRITPRSRVYIWERGHVPFIAAQKLILIFGSRGWRAKGLVNLYALL